MTHPPVPADEEGKFLFKVSFHQTFANGERITTMLRADTSAAEIIEWFQARYVDSLLVWFTDTDGVTTAVPARCVTQLVVGNPSPADLRQLNWNPADQERTAEAAQEKKEER